MKKKITVGIVTTAIALSMSMIAFAGQWTNDSIGWHYDKTGTGDFAASEWLWIDGNNDGIAECYYFDSASFMYSNTTTPDGYTVNSNGAWTVDGVIQTKQSATTSTDLNIEKESVTLDSLIVIKEHFGLKLKDSIRDGFNNLYSNAMFIDCRRAWEDCYSVYQNSGYTNLKADKVVLGDGDPIYGKAEDISVEIYDATTDELLDSISITPLTTSASLDVNITGHDLIKINARVSSKAGYSAKVIFKNLRFTK